MSVGTYVFNVLYVHGSIHQNPLVMRINAYIYQMFQHTGLLFLKTLSYFKKELHTGKNVLWNHWFKILLITVCSSREFVKGPSINTAIDSDENNSVDWEIDIYWER